MGRKGPPREPANKGIGGREVREKRGDMTYSEGWEGEEKTNWNNI